MERINEIQARLAEINARSWADGVIDLAARSEAELDERRRRLRLKIQI